MVSRRASGLAEVVGIQGVSLDHSDIDPIQNHAGFRASGIGSPLSSASPLPLLPAPPLSPPHPTPACRLVSHNSLYQVVLVVKNPLANAGDKEMWV